MIHTDSNSINGVHDQWCSRHDSATLKWRRSVWLPFTVLPLIVGLSLTVPWFTSPTQQNQIPPAQVLQVVSPGTTQPSGTPEQPSWNQFGHSRGWLAEAPIEKDARLVKLWEQEVGEGQSQIVGSHDRIFVASGTDQQASEEEPRIITTSFAAYDVAAGKELWKFKAKSTLLKEQQTFGGNRPTPQATPLLIQDRLIGLSFTGQLFCLDRRNGNELWSIDLCDKFQADAVQFGFSASPVKASSSAESFVVQAAGENGGLCKIKAADGELVWRCPVASFSYATPVFTRIAGVPQWIVTSREHVLAVGDDTGKELWRHTLASPGLTNVPCPLIVDGRHLVISGQGVGGTRGLEVGLESGKWSVKETWFNRRIQFFYTNWIMLQSTIALGCTEQYMTAFDVLSGEQLGRWRGFGNGNVLKLSDEVLVLGGKGQMSLMHLDASLGGLTVDREYEIANQRCWTAPSTIGGKCFIRSGTKLNCLAFMTSEKSKQVDPTLVLDNAIKPGAELQLAMTRTTASTIDPVEEIFQVFENQGQVAALELYQKLRSGKKLTGEHHVALAEAAYQMNLKELASRVMRDGQVDHPNSRIIKKKLAEWSGASR
ncbi:MAG TPA: hypothetical protein DDW52_19445 [Planctomycetaceae bacterium]|nr:hypothetical protein [Planctomycetaceae bacterium]